MTSTPPDTGAAAERERVPASIRLAAAEQPVAPGHLKRVAHRWARWLHVYTSMIALLVVLFFGITGITLNHPTWTFGDDLSVTTESGTLPFSPTTADGSIDYLSVSEFVRDTYGVNGHVDSFGATNDEASIDYRNPGFAADMVFDPASGEYELTIEQQGWVAVVNDLHKGRDTKPGWNWLIDVSAVLLVVVALTGLTMQFFLRKRRTAALLGAGVGALLTIVAAWLTLH